MAGYTEQRLIPFPSFLFPYFFEQWSSLHLFFISRNAFSLILFIFTVFPECYTFPIGTSMNGSSPTGSCSRGTYYDTQTTCQQPNSSVLFDGCVPTLTGLDGDMWASQLLTINTMDPNITIIFDFTDTPGYDRVERVEVVMLNCPQWGRRTTDIHLLGATASGQPFTTIQAISVSSNTSCDSLVRVYIPASVSLPVLALQFSIDPNSEWVHLAEVTFYGSYPLNTTLTPELATGKVT